MYKCIYRVKNLPAVLLIKMVDYCIQNSILVHRVIDATVGGAGWSSSGVGGVRQGRGQGYK